MLTSGRTTDGSSRTVHAILLGSAVASAGLWWYWSTTKRGKALAGAGGDKASVTSPEVKTGTAAPAVDSAKAPALFSDPNDPRDEGGRVHHLQVKNGDVANRVLSVGDAGRAERIAKLLDPEHKVLKITSSRGFITYTGRFRGVLVSVIATGMGISMADFVIRETRAVVEGPMAILRYGTCGGLNGTPTSAVVVATEGGVVIRREPDLFTMRLAARAAGKSEADLPLPYSVSDPIPAHAGLSELFYTEMEARVRAAFEGRFPVLRGMDASADSFYGSQGRVTRFFDDFNETLIARLEADPRLGSLRSLEMETALLFDVARSAKPTCPIYAGGAAMVLANRHGNAVITKAELIGLEEVGGRAALEALVQFEFPAAPAAVV